MKRLIKILMISVLVFVVGVCSVACGKSENSGNGASDGETAGKNNGVTAENSPTESQKTADVVSEISDEGDEAESNDTDVAQEVEEVGGENSNDGIADEQEGEKKTHSGKTDAEKVAEFVADYGGTFGRLFNGMYGDVASASVSADGTTVVIGIKVTEYSSADYKKQKKVNAESVVDSAMSSKNLVGVIRGIEPAVSGVSVSVCGNDGVTVFSKSYH